MIVLLLLCALGAELIVGDAAPTVQATVDLAKPGDVVVLPQGAWPGPVRLDKAITLRSGEGVLVTSGTGHTVIVAAPGVVIDGLVIRGSGTDLQGPDACIRIESEATGAVVQNSRMEDCLFGIWVHETHGARLLHNEVLGLPDARPSDKGNGIHLFNADGLEVRGNTVRLARDGIYVAATENSVIADNEASDQRYGIHYMYSYDNEISGNIMSRNSGGIALMSSLRLLVHHNVARGNTKQGILFRDLQYCDIHHNEVSGNGEGFFFFSSLDNRIHHNELRGNQVGARVWAGTERNEVWANRFVSNGQQVLYVAATDQQWGTEAGGNYWSDYLGWDQDGDGFGDRPYKADVTTARLLHRFPQAVLLLSSPTLELLRAVQARMPLLHAPTIIDARPLLSWSEAP